jgi:ABC-type glycerol-3-phosphate transport system permease component
MVVTSIKPATEIYEVTWIPRNPTLYNYWEVLFGLRAANFPRYLLNSFVVATSTTAITIPCATLMAYSFSRFRIWGRSSFIYIILATQMFPSVLLMIPMYKIFLELSWLNSYQCLFLAYSSFALPFSTLMMKSFFDSIPQDLEEAAEVDGCSKLGAFARIAIPLVAPGLAATSIFAFVLAWDDFMYALTFTLTDDMRTVTVGIKQFQGLYQFLWTDIMAGSIIMAIPVVILFAFIQKYLVRGLTAGAVKA